MLSLANAWRKNRGSPDKGDKGKERQRDVRSAESKKGSLANENLQSGWR